jgi:hypothetical protein
VLRRILYGDTTVFAEYPHIQRGLPIGGLWSWRWKGERGCPQRSSGSLLASGP